MFPNSDDIWPNGRVSQKLEKCGIPLNQIQKTIIVGNTDLVLVAAMEKCNIIFTKFFCLWNLTWRLAVSLKGKNFAAWVTLMCCFAAKSALIIRPQFNACTY